MGILADKDVQQILRLLEQVSDEFYFVDFDNPRAMAAQNLLGLSKATSKNILVDYVQFLQVQSDSKRRTVVSGSLYLLTAVRNSLKV